MDNNLDFAKNVIKGKIAEIVFEFMFRTKGYTVFHNGYEYTQTLIAQHFKLLKEKGLYDTLRSSPDFLLFSENNTEVYSVEVKYRSELPKKEDIKELAEKIRRFWEHTFLFISTPQGFYYDSCNTIINKDGEINKLQDNIIPDGLQQQYLRLLNDFEKKAQ